MHSSTTSISSVDLPTVATPLRLHRQDELPIKVLLCGYGELGLGTLKGLLQLVQQKSIQLFDWFLFTSFVIVSTNID